MDPSDDITLGNVTPEEELSAQSTIAPQEETSPTTIPQEPNSSNDLSGPKPDLLPRLERKIAQKMKPNITSSTHLHPAVTEPPKEPPQRKPKRLTSACGQQWIQREFQARKKIDHLGVSARFRYVNLEIKLHNEGCLMATDNNFVAQVKIADPVLLDGVGEFADVREVLVEQLRIVKVMRDDLREERERLRAELVPTIAEAVLLGHARNCIALFELRRKLMESDRFSYRRLCREISTDRVFSIGLRAFAKRLLELEEVTLKRIKWFARFGLGSEELNPNALCEDLNEALRTGFSNHRKQLNLFAPVFLRKLFEEVNQYQLMMINIEDVQVFDDLRLNLDNQVFKKPIEDLAKRWINSVSEKKFPRQSNSYSVFLLLCKSLQELIVEIVSKSETPREELLMSDSNGWYPAGTIKWKFENSFTKCLEREYRFIFEQLDKFGLHKRTREPFHYCPLVLNRFSIAAHINETKRLIRFHRNKKSPFNIPDDIYIWYCMVDHILASMISIEKVNPCGTFKRFDAIFKYFTNNVFEVPGCDVEKIRKLSHALVHYVVQFDQIHSSPLSSDVRFNHETFDVKLDLDSAHSWFVVQIIKSRFWVEGLYLLRQNVHLPGMKQIFGQFCEITNNAGYETSDSISLAEFYCVINEFALRVTNIQIVWHNRDPNNQMIYSEIVSNSYEPIYHRISSFLNPDQRIESLKRISKHYEFKVINETLALTMHLLRKNQWPTSGTVLTGIEKLTLAADLVKKVNSAIDLLPKKENYVSFDVLHKKLIMPFHNAVETSTSADTCSRRINEAEALFKENPLFSEKETLQSFINEGRTSVRSILWSVTKKILLVIALMVLSIVMKTIQT